MGLIETNIMALGEARQLLASAMDHHSVGNLAEAERVYLSVIRSGYRIVDVLPLVAGLASGRGDNITALAHWTRLLALEPSHIFALTEKAALLHRLGRWNEAASCLEAALQLSPGSTRILANLGIVLSDAGRQNDALQVFRRLAILQPGNPSVQHHVRRITSTIVPFWHIPMLNDHARNDAFEKAIRKAVDAHGCDAKVLDIGAGSGLLSMMAARAGAKDVVCCESVGVIAETAREIVELNGLADQIRVIAKKSDQLEVGVDLGGQADILVSEILSSDLLSEGVLSTFEDALSRLVNRDATIIPRSVTARGCLIESDVLANAAFVGNVSGFNVKPFTALANQRLPVHGKQTPWRRLSDDTDLLHIDLRAPRHDPGTWKQTIRVTSGGLAAGIMQWMRVDLADGIEYTNAPEDCSVGGWLQILHTFSEAIAVQEGELLEIVVGHDRTSLIVIPDRTPSTVP